jgi:hypothetical protein
MVLEPSILVRRLLEPEILVFCIPIVLIALGGLVKLSKMFIDHRERMAMIEMGIHPDCPPDEENPTVSQQQ